MRKHSHFAWWLNWSISLESGVAISDAQRHTNSLEILLLVFSDFFRRRANPYLLGCTTKWTGWCSAPASGLPAASPSRPTTVALSISYKKKPGKAGSPGGREKGVTTRVPKQKF